MQADMGQMSVSGTDSYRKKMNFKEKTHEYICCNQGFNREEMAVDRR